MKWLRAEHRYGEANVGNVGCFISPALIAGVRALVSF
jgi:hypothetical protein